MRSKLCLKLLGKEEGQILLWLAFGLPILILFAAMAIDMGVIYQSKARLSNAVDSAVLTAAKNYSQGAATAESLGTDMFQANYGSTSPVLTWTWCPGTSGCIGSDLSATLHASANVDTTFMAYLPQWAQWTIGDTGQATRSTLVMNIVLDRSGSMCGGSGVNKCPTGTTGDDGGDALQAAVPLFLQNFVPGTDYIGLVSFASNATVNTTIATNWGPWNSGPIYRAVQNMKFSGGTFGTGAGTNSYSYSSNPNGPPLSMADYENNTITLPAGQPETKVVVYFTDGLMNTIQDVLACTNIGSTLYNFGGYDTNGGNSADFFNPATGEDLSTTYANSTTSKSGRGSGCSSSSSSGLCNGYPPFNTSNACYPVYQFHSQSSGTNISFALDTKGNMDRADITTEAQYRAIYTANQMRNETIGTYIFVIGLGNSIVGNTTTEHFLSTLANDPSGPSCNGTCSNANLPVGRFLEVPACPGTQCTAQLTYAFQVIANMVALRLTQ